MQGLFWGVSPFPRVCFPFFLFLFLGGCLIGVSTGDVMVRPEVGQYHRLALAGLEPPAEERFRTMFMETFPETEFLAREELLEVLPGGAFFSGRLSDEVRGGLRTSKQVDAVVALTWEDSGMGGTLDWLLTITDTETGATTGMVSVQVRKEPLARGVDYSELEGRAFKELISALYKRLSR